MKVIEPEYRAWAGVVLFAISAAIESLLAYDSIFFIPQILFFAVLVLNSYYSIKLHSHIQPRSFTQALIDFLLTIAYIFLAFSLGQPILFPFCALVIFVLAPAKYVLMLDQVPHSMHLKRKILIDLYGTMLATMALGLAIMGAPLLAAWLMAIVNTLANIYYLAIKPMYLLTEA